jgi:hypothetical protein
MTRVLSRVVLFAALSLVLAAPLQAQVRAPTVPDWRIHRALGFGYMGNAPHALLGAMAWVITPVAGGTGVFVDARMTHKDYEDDALFEPGVTSEQAQTDFGHFYIRSVESWRSARIGLVRPLSRDFALYGGVGYGDGTIYDEYLDDTGERGVAGSYRALNDVSSGGRVSLTGGAIFRFGEALAFQFGLDTAPRGFSVGASLVLQ